MTHTIGIYVLNVPDRRLLAEFVRGCGHVPYAPELPEEKLESPPHLSLILTDGSTGERYLSHLEELRARSEVILPTLVCLRAGVPGEKWYRRGFEDILRLPLTRAELTARTAVFLKVREESLRAEEALRRLASSGEALRVARDMAVAANAAKRTFLAKMSHELRTPLNGIIGLVEILRDAGLPPEYEEHRSNIGSCAQMLLRLIEEVLEFSSNETRPLRLQSSILHLPHLVRGSLSLLEAAAVAKGLRLELDLDPALPELVMADPLRLRQALGNLLNNALRFTDRGRIRLGAQTLTRDASTATVRFEVDDTGIGVPVGSEATIFKPFVQEEGEGTWRAGGVGLGLTITRQIVEAMGGTIGLTPHTDGPGTTFWFTAVLPLATAAPAEPVHEAQSARVLVAEDNPINQRVLLYQLRQLGYAADAVGSGREVLEALASRDYDVILMDLQMPDLDGYQTARRIHESSGHRSPPAIVALTAGVGEADREKSLEAGMQEHLTKPVLLEDLARVLRRWTGVGPPE